MSAPSRGRFGRLALVFVAVAVAVGCGPGLRDDEPAASDSSAATATGAVASGQSVETSTGATVGIPTTETPTLDPQFEAIAERASLTEEGKRLLATSSPELDDLGALGTVCTLETEASVLGCYRAGRIAVLAVTDPRLDGMVEVTTAHELLHAAWATYDEAERERLGALLRIAYQRVATPELEERLDLYRRRDAESVDGELYSILGTEVSDVGPELEEHYRRWFVDRSEVVALAAEVQSTFSSLKAEVDELDTRLEALRSDIEARQVILDSERAGIDARSEELDQLLAAGRLDEYNAGIDPYNEQVAEFNASIRQLRELIDQFNRLAAERNALAEDYSELVSQITATPESVARG